MLVRGDRLWYRRHREGAVGFAGEYGHGLAAGPDWTVEKLAVTASLSRAAFARRFTALVGEPPLTYLRRWRMTTAAQLLGETDKTLDQVAVAIGYGSAFAFAKAFRREYATTPGDYRRSSRTGVTKTATPEPVA